MDIVYQVLRFSVVLIYYYAHLRFSSGDGEGFIGTSDI
jgi:hypothetical protein